jgi:GNAT superfamily N-acetyltransferase
MTAPLTYRRFVGADLAPFIDDLAHLRITIFRDWPYLYQGDVAYEAQYLRDYAQGDAIMVGAFDGTRLVGASTGMPLQDRMADFTGVFDGTDFDIPATFYCAESVLLPDYRGQGAGAAFFAARHDHAKGLGLMQSAFCAVDRPDHHPLRPIPKGRHLSDLWRRLGYAPCDGVYATMSWRDIGAADETAKRLLFWRRAL